MFERINDFLANLSDKIATVEPWLRFSVDVEFGPLTLFAGFSLDNLQFMGLANPGYFHLSGLGFRITFTWLTP